MCSECHWCRAIEDCELDDFGERLWCEEHGIEYQEEDDDEAND